MRPSDPVALRVALLHAVALVAACGSVDEGSPQGLGWSKLRCDGDVWTPSGPIAFAIPTAHLVAWGRPRFVSYDTGPCCDTDAEDRTTLELSPPRYEHGTACADAPDPEQCRAELDRRARGYGFDFHSTDGGVVRTWPGGASEALFGLIGSADEAVLRTWAEHWDATCSNTRVRAVGGAWEVAWSGALGICPLQYGWEIWRVTPNGTLAELPDQVVDEPGACIGRRAPGGPSRARCLVSAGATLARHAALEAESVVAFGQLERELRAHGAPTALLAAVRRAARDESRHARQIGALARRYGRTPEPANARLVPIRSLKEIALDNAVEGCVGETIGAAIGLYQAEHAQDAVVAATMRKVARDEVRHAALSWALHHWLCEQLTTEDIEEVEAALTSAWQAPRLGRGDPALGLPDGETARRLAADVRRGLAA